ncbi:MAG: hypothetical protein NXI20_19455 [bacterium]|nr:hypothetical protein [bacterium]
MMKVAYTLLVLTALVFCLSSCNNDDNTEPLGLCDLGEDFKWTLWSPNSETDGENSYFHEAEFCYSEADEDLSERYRLDIEFLDTELDDVVFVSIVNVYGYEDRQSAAIFFNRYFNLSDLSTQDDGFIAREILESTFEVDGLDFVQQPECPATMDTGDCPTEVVAEIADFLSARFNHVRQDFHLESYEPIDVAGFNYIINAVLDVESVAVDPTTLEPEDTSITVSNLIYVPIQLPTTSEVLEAYQNL